MQTFREKVNNLIGALKHSHKLRIAGIALLIAAIPLTIYIGQQQQDIRQKASTGQFTVTLDKTFAKPGETVRMSWVSNTAISPTTPVSPTDGLPAQCTPRPNVVINPVVTQPGKMQATITAGNNTGRTDNLIKSFNIKQSANVTVTIAGTTYTPPSTTTPLAVDITDIASTSIIVNQVQPDVAAQLNYEIVDECGPFSTFTGGGATAWTAPSPSVSPTVSPSPIPSVAQLTMTPSTVVRGAPITLAWNYTSGTPSTTDQFEVLTPAGIHSQSFYLSSCTTTPGTNTATSGQCTTSIPTQNYGPATYTVKLYKNADTTKVIGQTTFTVTATQGYAPSLQLIPKAFAQTTLTGAETYQLFLSQPASGDRITTPTAIGEKQYLNCTVATTTPPTTPISEGFCDITIPTNAIPGTYFFRILAADGTTEIGISPNVTVTEPNITSCTTDADCANEATNKKCWKSANYPGRCGAESCTQATTYACNTDTPTTCDTFANACSVPPGWKSLTNTDPKITGVVYEDLNANGVLDASDTRLANREVLLSTPATGSEFGPIIMKTKSNATGEYILSGNLTPGKLYRVTYYIPTGFMRTTDDSQPFTMPATGDATNHNFGITQTTHKNGLISYWNMDIYNGPTIIIDAQGTNNGIGYSDTSETPGKIKNARMFGDHGKQFIRVPYNASLAPDTFTVTAWVFPTDANSLARTDNSSIYNMRKSDNSDRNINFEIEGDATSPAGQMHCDLVLKKPDGSIISIRIKNDASKLLKPSEWNHVTCSYDGTTGKMYINGSLAGSQTMTGTLFQPTAADVLIGKNTATNQIFKGKIDEVGFWNRALTDFEIQYLAFGNSPIENADTTAQVSLTMVPAQVSKGTVTQVQFQYPETIQSTPNDLFSVYKEDATGGTQFVPDSQESARITNMYASNCLATPTTATRTSGACNIETAALTPGRYTVRLFANNGFTQRIGIKEFTVTDSTTAATKFTVTAALTGIGQPSGTFAPLHPTRPVFVSFFDAANTLIARKQGTLTYNQATGTFTSIIDLANACTYNPTTPDNMFYCNPTTIFTPSAGNYTIKVWTPQFLQKQIPGIISVQPNTQITLPEVKLTAGDINLDNKVNITDYNILLTCYSSKMTSEACKNLTLEGMKAVELADINDDGTVDGIDYNLFIIGLATKEGD